MHNEKIEGCGRRIAKALSIRGMKQTDLCNATGIPKSAMSQYIKGSFEPKQDRIYLLAQALEVSEAWLMGYDVPMEREPLPTEIKNLTEGERLLLNLFNKVPEESQEMVLDMIRIALKKKK